VCARLFAHLCKKVAVETHPGWPVLDSWEHIAQFDVSTQELHDNDSQHWDCRPDGQDNPPFHWRERAQVAPMVAVGQNMQFVPLCMQAWQVLPEQQLAVGVPWEQLPVAESMHCALLRHHEQPAPDCPAPSMVHAAQSNPNWLHAQVEMGVPEH